jgi:hypothetical protein
MQLVPYKRIGEPEDGADLPLRKGDAFFADLDPPQIFALRADEILGNERGA